MDQMPRRNFMKHAGACIVAAGASGLMAPSGELLAAPDGVDRPQWARKRFLEHWNCSQAVLEAYAERYGVPAETAMRIAAPFAGGMGAGWTCGAVTGALLVIGLAHGRISDKDAEADKATFSRVAELTKAMQAEFGDLSCSVLLGADMATPDGVKAAADKGLFASFCPRLVQTAAAHLERLL